MKLKYLVYLRKSSDREDTQVLSIPAQKRELDKIIQSNKLDVVDILSETRSAYHAGRPEFNRMLEMIEKGQANAILTYHLTRIARNSLDGGRVIYMMDQGYIDEIRSQDKSYSNSSDDKFIMQINFAMAKKSSDDTSNFVKRDIQSKLLKGEYPGTVPNGYLNMDKYGIITGKKFDSEKQKLIENHLVETNRNFRRVEPDPILAPIVKKIFEEFVKGSSSIGKIANFAFENGIAGYRSQKTLADSSMSAMLTNPFYYGAIKHKGKLLEPEDLPEETRHIGIISKSLFEKVQKILSNNSRPRPQIHNFAYTGLMKCGECGCSITAETKRGVTYYRCTKKRGSCSQKYIKEENLENEFKTIIDEYSIPKEFQVWALEQLSKEEKENTENYEASIKSINRQLVDVGKELSSLLKMKISPKNVNGELLSDDEYLSEKMPLIELKKDLTERLNQIEINRNLWFEQCEEFLEFATQLSNVWKEGNKERKKLIVSFAFGSTTILQDQKVNITAQLPFVKVTMVRDLDKWRDQPGSNRQPLA